MTDDYLWDPDARPEPELEELERALGRHRWRPAELPELPGRAAAPSGADRGRWRPLWIAAGIAAAALVALRLLPDGGAPAGSYRLEVLAGRPTIAGGAVESGLGAGQVLDCPPGSRARVVVGSIGSVVVEPETRLRVERVEASDDAEHRLYLERGTVAASIFAAPRVFQLGTPGGIAVDLGCVYRATVEASGETRLSVVSGKVSFEAGGREVFVPTGASALALPGRGPGTPVWDDAPPAFRAAVEALDRGDAELRLAPVLATEREADSLTLWHLLAHGERSVRERVGARLAALAPPPAGVSLAACIDGERAALDRWRRSFDWARW